MVSVTPGRADGGLLTVVTPAGAGWGQGRERNFVLLFYTSVYCLTSEMSIYYFSHTTEACVSACDKNADVVIVKQSAVSVSRGKAEASSPRELDST